jgi:hypothetical protein
VAISTNHTVEIASYFPIMNKSCIVIARKPWVKMLLI